MNVHINQSRYTKNAVHISDASDALSAGMFKGVLVCLQKHVLNDALHPISFELVGEGARLASDLGVPLYALLIGERTESSLRELSGVGINRLFLYDGPEFKHFRDDLFAAAAIDCMKTLRPEIVLFGATNEGRSIAPRTAVYFRTGLTADCTELRINDRRLLVQVRPAFGGNVLAEILTEHTRPQIVTLRQGIMPRIIPCGNVFPVFEKRSVKYKSSLTVKAFRPIDKTDDIADARILLAVGSGVCSRSHLTMFDDFARKIGGMLASSRALVEKGWMTAERQIGLSGKAVSPEFLLICGISGSVQFQAGIRGAKKVVAINRSTEAPIFAAAHEYIVGDMYDILPRVIKELNLS